MFKGRSSFLDFTTAALFLVAILSGFFSLSASASADVVPQTMTAYVTETVILPCRITVDGQLPTIEWSKEGLSENIALLYRDGCETFEMKNPTFRYRTNLVLNKLKEGNISQIIYNLRRSDGGRYLCRTLSGRRWQVHAILDLVVASVSEPKLAIVPSTTGGGGVTLECKAECWYPEPKMIMLDDEEHEIKSENPTTVLEPTECYTITRRANVQTHINRVICRVYVTGLNQTKNTAIYIPDHCMGSCTVCALVTGITVMLTTLIITIIFFISKKSCGRKQVKSEDTTVPIAEADRESLKSKESGSSQQDQTTHNSRYSPNGTEEVTRSSSSNPSMGHGHIPLLSREKPKNTTPSTSKGLLNTIGFQRSLSHQLNCSEESESLLEKSNSQNK